MWDFWNNHVPNFLDMVREALDEFAKEVHAAFSK